MYKSKGNAIVIVLVVITIIMPLGFIMMQRSRNQTFQVKKAYDSLILSHASLSGIELIIDNLRKGDFSSGPHTGTIADGISFQAYVDTSGIGLTGQKVCHIFSKSIGDGGDSILFIAEVGVYPKPSTNIIVPKNYYTQYEDYYIDAFSARAAILNGMENDHVDFVEGLKVEGKLKVSEYQNILQISQSSIPNQQIKDEWTTRIIPLLISHKAAP
ncbi:MAG: hypothetical protein COB02_05795 [Candidatus Cloacimonadota bacterium]|nr:MAG: hypothetical protein COB02_05795 [Candidatus Cloacimonadota bacterium]